MRFFLPVTGAGRWAVFIGVMLSSPPAWAQVLIPPEPSQELELPSLEEELGIPKPWHEPPAVAPAIAAPAVETEQDRQAKTVKLNGLDKITGRISEFEAPVDQPAQFGTLQITARTCHKRPQEEAPETSAYLEIADLGFAASSAATQPAGQKIFAGWMFASSPSLSALEHPVYDVWIIDCSTSLPQADSGIE